MDDAYSFQVYFILAIGDIRGVKILSDYNYIYSSDFYFVFSDELINPQNEGSYDIAVYLQMLNSFFYLSEVFDLASE